MSVVILNVLCEGQSEQIFARKVLNKYLQPFNIIVRTNLLVTNKKKNATGGMIDFAHVNRDFRNMVNTCHDTGYETNYFTTMFDLYALPKDFPGYNSTNADPYQYVSNIEDELYRTFNCPKFIPYIQLHEFETLILCNPNKLKQEYPKTAREIERMDKQWRTQYNNNPELVNTSYKTAPSRRITKALEGKYKYNKPMMAEMVTTDIGIDALRGMCSHFNQWVEKIIGLSSSVL